MAPHSIVIMGRPGSGKGTQAEFLAQKLGARVVSLGKEFRSLAAGTTYLGKKLKTALDAGELMPTWFADYLCEKELLFLEPWEKVVFDSGCRIKSEAELFHDIHAWLERDYLVVYIDVSEAEIQSRIAKRQTLEDRADDVHTSLRKRIDEFETKTTLSLQYFESIEKLVRIPGEASIEEVQTAILKSLNLE